MTDNPIPDADAIENAPADAAPDSRSWTAPASVGLAYFVFYQIAFRLPDGIFLILLSTVVSLGLAIWFTALAARTLRTAPTAALNLVAAFAIVIPIRLLSALHHPAAFWIQLVFGGLPDLALMWMAVAAGVLLSHLVRTTNMIPPIAGALALVDVWTVLLGGPVNRMMHSSSAAARTVTRVMTVQLAGNPTGATPIPIVGFADFLFIAFFVAAICRLAPRPGVYERSVRALAAVLVPYMVLVFVKQWELPALVPIALAMVGVHWREFRYTRAEGFALFYAGILVVGIIAAFTVLHR